MRHGILPAMKSPLPSAVAALALLLLTACGHASPAGTYDVDKAAFKAVMLASMPAAARSSEATMAEVDDMVANMSTTIDLAADGTATMEIKMSMMGREMNSSAVGTWHLAGTKLTIAMQKDGEDDTKVAEYDGASFTIEDNAGGQRMKMVFHRR